MRLRYHLAPPTFSDTMTIPDLNLVNHFLIAMPSMLDPMFGGAVVYVCEHNAEGALGIVINKPTDINIDDFFNRLDLKFDTEPTALQPVLFGGPVQNDRGFVLHAASGDYSSTLEVTATVSFTTSLDVLEAVAAGTGPERLLISIGYSGWSAGQLEYEVAQNCWLTVAADLGVIFDTPVEQRYDKALMLLGLESWMISPVAGHA